MALDRQEWITNLRGLAILAVVVGHVATPLSQFIYAWHIPLFFLLSGLLLSSTKSLLESIKNDFKKLILPFIIFGLIGLLAEYVKRWIWPSFDFVNQNINLKDELLGIFWWMDYAHMHQYGFVLWYLPALFWAKNFYLWFIKIFKNKALVSVISFGFLWLIINSDLILPFGLDKGLMGLFWLSLGWLLTGRFWLVSVLILFFMKVPITNIAVKVIDVYGIAYSLLMINSLVGLFKFGQEKFKGLNIFGRNSMLLFVTHPYINNLIFFATIYLLKLNWMIEVLLILMVVAIETNVYEKISKI